MAQITLRDYLQEIEDALKSKRTEEALAKSQRALEHFPESLEAQRLLGEVYLAQGQLEEAQQAFDWVLTNDPENVVVYCDRALISEREADYETALDCYQQAYELSRGNSSIRELFNALSLRTGQQGFMFSRAGLARLYMRGDLLSQSIQEWETVLAAMPDRLDARVGLLETYWREGSYDKVDELSRQILNDVPGCLKALLLQAYVTSPRDMLEAQDIMRRAEMLDPDLVMAQDLFSDLITSQASNPFLKLIRKKPATLESANGKVATPPAASGKDYAQATPEALLNIDLSNDVLAHWNDLDDWNGIDTFKPKPQQPPAQAEQSMPTLTTWTADTAAPADPWQMHNTQQPAASSELPNVDAWESPDRSPEPPQGFQFDAWQVSESHPVDLTTPTPPVPPTPEHKPWEGSEDATYTAPNFDDLNSWSNFNTLQSEDAGNTWSSGSSSNDGMSAAPAWLSMLTQADQHQPGLPAIPAEPPVELPPAPEPPSAAQAQPPIPVTPAPAPQPQPTWEAEPALPAFAMDADEEFSFGPEWLKSLGAASIGEEPPVAAEPKPEPQVSAPPPVVAEEPVAPPAPAVSEPEPEPQPAFDPWATTAPPPSFGNPADENLLATLEDLEQSLRAQGFVPHAPNTLSVIAQEQPEPVAQQEAVPYELSDLTSALAQQRAALSSALEQLGSLNEQYQSVPAQPMWPAPEPPAQPIWSAPEPPAQPLWSAPTPAASPVWSAPEPDQPAWSAPEPEPEPAAPLEEPAWVAALRAVPAPPPLQEQPFYKDGAPTLIPPVYIPPAYTPPALPEKPLEPAAHVNTYAAPQYQPQPAPAPEPSYVQQTVPQHIHTEPDNELEMTMKRPALRLPLTPQPQPPSHERVSDATEAINTVGKMRSTANHSRDVPLSARDRLLKGYQYQQRGDYDEAMQEYRFLIRNAPDLLTEIVNNLRALLKSVPRYAPGYRVLGDAYMRQGEYLQAMESYNKALTMAKKARA